MVVGQAIELTGSHNHCLGHIATDPLHPLGQDTNLDRDRLRGLGMVASQHMHGDAGFVALADRGRGLGARRVVQPNQTAKCEILLDCRPLLVVAVLGDLQVDLAAGQGKYAQAKPSKHFHVARDQLAKLVRHRKVGFALAAVPAVVPRARSNDLLDGALGESELLSRRVAPHHDAHALDVAVEGIFGHLGPLGPVALGEGQSVPREAAGEDLDGDLGRVAAGMPLAFFLEHGGQAG